MAGARKSGVGRTIKAAGLSIPLLIAADVAGLDCTSALAQTAPTAPDQAHAANQGLAEIVITAEKRDSTVQKTPISITAISGDDLQAAGIASFTGVAQETPGVAIRSAGPGQTEIDMRGLTSSGGNSPTTGFYLDEMPVSPPAGANNGKVVIDPNLYDLGRVEVLRGPQGTLYGSGSMGGTVKLLTTQPDPTRYSGSAELTGSGTEGGGANGNANLMANLPIVEDKVALRVVGTELYNSGWIDRTVLSNFPLEQDNATNPPGAVRGNVADSAVQTTHSDVNWEKLEGARVSLLFKPTDALSITTNAFYQRIEQGGYDTFDSPPGKTISTPTHYQPFDIAEPFSDTFGSLSLVVKYEFEDFEVTSATSEWSREEKQAQDLSEDFQWLLNLPSYLPASLTEYDYSRQFSQELRVASTGSGPFNWLVGAFYSKFDSNYKQVSYSAAYEPVVGLNDLIDETEPQKVRQTALFANASYQIASSWKVTAGARLYDYQSTAGYYANGLFTSGDLSEVTSYNKESASGVTPMASIAFTPTDDFTAYSTVAKGFRPGGGNQYVPISGGASCLSELQALGKTGAPEDYNPDSVWSYELGEKAKLFDGRLTVNADVFYEKWKNIQLQVPLACGFFYTDNGERAGIYGTEAEIKAKVTDGLIVAISGGYTHADYGQDSPDTGFVKGQAIPDIPAYTFSISATYDVPAFGEYDFVARAENNHVGPMTDYTYSQNNLPGYNLINLRVGLVDERKSAYLFANNLGNVRAALSDTNSLGANLPTFNRVATNQPRTIGVTVGYKF
jgi:outer membrane receptor protein involved in Fe transport